MGREKVLCTMSFPGILFPLTYAIYFHNKYINESYQCLPLHFELQNKKYSYNNKHLNLIFSIYFLVEASNLDAFLFL